MSSQPAVERKERWTLIFRVEDNTEAPEFRLGDTVIVDPWQPLQDGCYVAEVVNETVAVRRFHEGDDLNGHKLLPVIQIFRAR